MSYRLDTHVLTVDANAIHKVDIGNLANLYCMWIISSRCADSVEQGRRLENFFWRLWQRKIRKTFVVDHEEKPAPTTRTLPQTIPSESKIPDLPMLSSSVETLVDEETVDSTPVSAPLGTACPHIRRQDSCASTRSKRERRISSDDLEKMIVSAVEDKGLPALPQFAPVSKKPLRAPPAFGEQDQSLSTSRPTISIIKKPVYQIGGSSEEDGSLKSAVASLRPSSLLSAHENQASFSNIVMTRTIDDEAAVDSDTDDCIDESAIDDDDDTSDWEDSMEESGNSSMDDRFFQRVDSKPNLTSRRSLITLMLAQNVRARNLGNHASKSTSAIPRSRMANGPSLGASSNDSDEAPLVMKRMRGPGLKPISNPQPIITGPNYIQPQAALSPRTTRRNMLETELTKSLRRHLLWERQQKSSTANAALKRRHTSHGMANLKQYPEKPCMKKSEDVNASSWNQYFSKEASDGYHSKGW
ncbi:hypothetical protein FNYG_15552 [Fusarium nygamai]|uniref:Uncharacterized protein n=1 Tax=Gibberella nygamai TaxID=42673 RepID=A0A2K0UBP3_GIBNY|nr:hypothetical protein FNYG_15552 [Fusarium nygamai]